MDALPLYPDIVVRLTAAVLLGGIIGLERQIHGRPAGIRTHILVCMGATIIMFLPGLIKGGSAASAVDINARARIIAGIVTGIGFLGAGAIIRIGDTVRGLTTAAGIWFTAALGAVIGSGFLVLAIVFAAAGVGITIVFDKLEERIPDAQYRELYVLAAFDRLQAAEEAVRAQFDRKNLELQDTFYEFEKSDASAGIRFVVKNRDMNTGRDLVLACSRIEGVKHAAWKKHV